MKKNLIYQIIIWALLIASTFVLIQLAPILSRSENLLSDDYFHIWAAAKLNLEGRNPFDIQTIEQLRMMEGSGTFIGKSPIMLNPPWTIALFMPLSLLNYPISRLFWLILSIVLILVSVLLLWRTYSGNPKQKWLAILVVFIFGPTISVLEKGQVTTLVVLGITSFLYFSSVHRNDWMAGALLSLASVKPQVVLLFWVALLFWTILEKRWVILISFSLSILILTLFGTFFNPSLIEEYVGMLHSYNLSDWATPTIGSYLRYFWLGINNFWIQYLPSIIGGLWFIYYWVTHHSSWKWAYAIPQLLFVSIITSPYNWTYDIVVVIPGIIQAIIWLTDAHNRKLTLLFGSTYLVINILDLMLHRRFDEFWFIWLAPALFILFIAIHIQYSKILSTNIAPQANG